MKRSVQSMWLVAFGLTLSGGAMAAEDVGGSALEGFGALKSMGMESLEQTRGRDGANLHLEQVNVQSIQEMKAISSDASFDVGGNMISGNITFESGSMGHYSGTGIFNNVTGNANAINNAIGISVYIANP
ncbi:hypothetical protein [Halomonas smyrnensis]|uniref:hypothetical protein n=1 Tax=Halomonas smyrnensis TaxID=720605 RepID=UPI0012EA140A|nr:hypothetical protein [Halomonas smyrnensis]